MRFSEIPFRLHRSCLIATMTLLIPLLNGMPACSAETPQRPNIVLILVDDMGYGDPGCYNQQSKCRTPHIDRLAAEGMKFTDAHAAGGVCHPSRYGLLTGRYPFRHQRNWRHEPLIAENDETIPEMLQRAGYTTHMVGKWHLGFDNGPDYDFAKGLTGGPVDRGFQTYFGMPASLDIPPYYYIEGRTASPQPTLPIAANASPGWSPIQGAFWREGLRAGNFIMEDVLDEFGRHAVETVETSFSKEEPSFLYLALTGPHTPWLPAEEFNGRGGAGLYSEFVAHVDAVVGRVVDAVDASGEADNTMVIFSSDNGPVWYDNDEERFQHDSTGPLRGMKGDAWEGGHRMPFLIRWPAQLRGYSESEELIGFIDLLPTLAEITGTELNTTDRIDGRSFAALLDLPTKEPWPRGERVMLQHHSGSVIRAGSWKLITHLGSGGFSKPSKDKPQPGGPKGQLYDMVYDRGEVDNLWLEHPEIVEKLTRQRQEIIDAHE